MHVITATYTQGRFGNGRGQEYAEAYKIQYWRPGLTNFIDYHDSLGRTVIYYNNKTRFFVCFNRSNIQWVVISHTTAIN